MGATLALVILIVFFGLPLVFNLSTIISSFRPKVKVAEDRGIAPTAPRFSQEYTATKSAQIKLNGVADPGITVEIYQDNNLLGTTLAEDNGNFSYEITLNTGQNSFEARAISSSGEKSDRSEIYTINYSNKDPKLDLDNLKDGDTIKANPFNVRGKTDAGNSVTVNDHLAIVGGDGSFSYLLNLNNGDNKLKITAADPAGNQTSKELTVKYSP